MNVLIPISFLFILIYFIVFSVYRRAWKNAPADYPVTLDENLPLISVIIPFRNEETTIPNLVRSLSGQNYPQERVEYIFIDDHSGDNSSAILREHIRDLGDAVLLEQPSGRTGKKEALLTAVKTARNGIIVITDADCIHPGNWLRILAGYMSVYHPVLLSGPVIMSSVGSFCERFQALEFASLTGAGGASFLAGSAVMCNGANLAFRRELFLEAFSNLHKDIQSGDDIFLMLYAKKHYPAELHFIRHPGAIVQTYPVKGLWNFLRQRIRWVSKSTLYRDPVLILLSLLILGINAWMVLLIVSSFLSNPVIFIFAGLFILKTLTDYYFLKPVCHFYQQENLLKNLLPSQIIYPFYIFFTGMAGFFYGIKRRLIG
jgi:biofilm PGA synthesis N-glycosyltransferase PgaC